MGASSNSSGQGTIACLATSDIKGLKDRLLASGAEILQDFHDTPSGVILTFSDPDLNTFQLIQPGVKAASLG
jgi:predicted enzyme related to lactoylglutathione lyase